MRVVIVQPVLPKYEIPLLEKIAQLPGVDLLVMADLQTKSQLNQYDAGRDRFVATHLARVSVGGIAIRPGLIGKLRAARPDVVILNGDPRDVSQANALLWCKLRKIPVGVWSMFHRIGKRRLVSEVYMRYAGALADLMLSYGERGKKEQIRRGVDGRKILVLGTAIDEKSITAVRDSISEHEVNRFRESEGLQGKKILLHVVRLTRIKRPDVMVRCFAELCQRRSDVELVWIGGGPLENNTKRLAKSLGVAGRMRFLGPLYEEHKLGLWFKAADVFVMATCIGLSIHHAMCYGVPVLTDDNALTQTSEFEVLEDGATGFTYRSGDRDDFCRKVCMLLDCDELRARMSSEAMRRMEEECTLDRKVAKFNEAFRRLSELAGPH